MYLFRECRVIHSSKGRVRIRYIQARDFKTEQVRNYISSTDGVSSVRINKKICSVIAEYDSKILTPERIVEKLLKLKIEELKECPLSLSEERQHRALARASIALLSMPFLSKDMRLLVSGLATYPVVLGGVKALFKKGINAEVLDGTAVTISLFRRDFYAANTTNFMLELGEYIEGKIERKSTEMLKSLLVPSIDKVWVLREGTEVEIDIDSLKKGDIVAVSMGDTIPIDGIITKGEALVNEVSMSGEGEPVFKKRGDKAISGTLVTEGRIYILAENVGKESAVYRIAEYVENSLESKSKTESEARKLADSLVPVTIGLGTISYGLSRDINRVASVFQADYSCALKLATPVAFKSGMYKAGKTGVLIKGADVLERLSEVDTVVFDKTGTLTSGDLEIDEIVSLDDSWSKEDILYLAASIEEHYFHPVAEAVVRAAREHDKCTHFHHSEVEFIVAHGVGADVEGKRVVIGSRHFLEDDEKIDFAPAKDMIDEFYKEGKSVLYIGYGGKLLGFITLNDHLRSEAKEVITRLKELGVKRSVMLTGDKSVRAEAIAKEIGIDEWHAELLPEDKASIVKKLKDDGAKVAFVGDGINDAPSLAMAHTGISMSRGADIARVTSDVALLEDRLSLVCDAKETANKTVKLVKTNYNLTLGANSFILLLAGMGVLNPVATSLFHNGATIGILLNALRGIRLEGEKL